MTQKQSFADLIRRAGPVTPKMRKAAALESLNVHEKFIEDWKQTIASPEWRAMEKLETALRDLKNDPEISISEPCTDVLELVLDLLEQAWPHHDLQRVVAPMQKHFDGVKSKDANNKLKEKRIEEREVYNNFLDKQKDVIDTKLLAARLRKTFGVKPLRGSEDTVRAWKKLRSPGKTE